MAPERLRAIIDGTPQFWCIAGTGLVALMAQAALMRAALRRRAEQRRLRLRAEEGAWRDVAAAAVPSPRLELVALGALLLLPVVTFTAVQLARASAGGTPASGARAWSAWRGELDAISLGIVAGELAGGLGVVAWALAFSARRQIAGLVDSAAVAGHQPAVAQAWVRFPSPETASVVACACAVAALALLPALQGALSYCTRLTGRMASLGGADPAERLRQMNAALLPARQALEAGMTAAKLGLGLATVTCAALLWWRSPARARRQWLGTRR